MDISLREWLQGCAGNDNKDWFTETDLKINQLLYKVAQLEAEIKRPRPMQFSFMFSVYLEGSRHGGGGAGDAMYAPRIEFASGDNDTDSIIAKGGNGISESWYVPVNCVLTRVVTAHASVYNAALSKPPFLTIKRGQYSFPGTNNYTSASEVAKITEQITDVNIPFDRGNVFWISAFQKTANDGIVSDYIPLGGWTTCFFTATV